MQLLTNNSMEEQKQHGTFAFPVLLSHEVLSKYDSSSFICHWHNEIELTYITKGEMLYKIANNVLHVEEGDIIFCNSATLHSGKRCSQDDCLYISITVDPHLIYGYKGSQLYKKYVKPVVQNVAYPYMIFKKYEQTNPNVLSEIKKIEKLYLSNDVFYEIDILISLFNILKQIYKKQEEKNEYQYVDYNNLSRIRTIINYVNANYSNKIALSDISKCINICECECSRIFKKTMNISLFEYIGEYRIKKGAEILRSTNEPIGKISEMVGFNDANNFSRTFHKIMGLSPKEYRKKCKAENI